LEGAGRVSCPEGAGVSRQCGAGRRSTEAERSPAGSDPAPGALGRRAGKARGHAQIPLVVGQAGNKKGERQRKKLANAGMNA